MSMSRTPSGVLTLHFHTDGCPATFTGEMHTDFPRALYEIGEDRANRVLMLTGTGDRFMTDIDAASLGDISRPAQWDRTITEGRRVMQRLVDLEIPYRGRGERPGVGSQRVRATGRYRRCRGKYGVLRLSPPHLRHRARRRRPHRVRRNPGS
jgi:hypothetical protein